MALKLDLESRPSQSDYDNKMQQCKDLNESVAQLRDEVANLNDQMIRNQKLIDCLENDVKNEKMKQLQQLESLIESGCQTSEEWMQEFMGLKVNEEADCVSIKEKEKLLLDNKDAEKEVCEASSSDLENNNNLMMESDSQSEKLETSPERMDKSSTNHITEKSEQQDDDDENLLNHPKVLYEDELVTFKEKCAELSSENFQLVCKVNDLTENLKKMQDSAMNQFLMKYLVPILVFFVAFIYYLLKK